ncbi:DUF7507 domain-containing protein [Plantibacter sp. RU18]|uniref:DUF7507 domain-containing protein n=1 Tax=Plantibacter sp. RU18 TaxID=3158143 RepID=UPI003D367E1E
MQLVSLTGGDYEIGGASVSGIVGLDVDPTASPISFASERNALEIAASGVIETGNGDGYADLGETVTFVYQVVNSGNAPVSGVSVDGANCAATTLAAGASTECRSAPITATQADLDRGSIRATGSATGVSRLGATVASEAVDPSVATTPAAAAVGLQLTASTADGAAPAVGDRITLSVEWTNAGNVSIVGVSASIPALPELVADCTTGSLAPGESVVCELTGRYRVTQDDVDRGSILFTATGAARAGGAEITAPDAIASVTTEAAAPSVQLGAALAIIDGEAVPGMSATITSTITNSGNVTLSAITVAVDGRPELAIACPSGTLAPGETVDCESAIRRLTQADIDRGSLGYSLVANGVGPSGVPVTDRKTVSVDIAQRADVSLVTSAESDSSDIPAVGDAIMEHVTITNAGNVTLTEVSLDGAVCVAVLAPGEAVMCAAEV